jgi:hypothetical protein
VAMQFEMALADSDEPITFQKWHLMEEGPRLRPERQDHKRLKIKQPDGRHQRIWKLGGATEGGNDGHRSVSESEVRP